MTREDPAFERAKEHVEHVGGFYYHLMVFVLVNAMLVIVDLRLGGLDWVYWVIIGWGFGIAGHAIYAFFGVRKLYAEARVPPALTRRRTDRRREVPISTANTIRSPAPAHTASMPRAARSSAMSPRPKASKPSRLGNPEGTSQPRKA